MVELVEFLEREVDRFDNVILKIRMAQLNISIQQGFFESKTKYVEESRGAHVPYHSEGQDLVGIGRLIFRFFPKQKFERRPLPALSLSDRPASRVASNFNCQRKLY